MNAIPPAGAIARRSTHLLAGGLYRFEDTLALRSTIRATIVTCTAWLLELYQVDSGDIVFLTGTSETPSAARRFAAVFPPFSITRLRLDCTCGRVIGFAASSLLPPSFSETPTLLELPANSGAMLPPEILQSAVAIRPVPAWPHASALSRRAKKIIDRNYLAHVSLAQIATQLGVTAAHLSRQFKRDFQMTPSTYLHQLRLADARFKLAHGEEIADVSLDVGYADLSRFYKQFRKATQTSPGVCRAMIAPRQPGRRS